MAYPNLTQEERLVNDLLLAMAGKAAKGVDSFSGWMMGGHGLAATILVSQFATLAKHLSGCAIKWTLCLFVGSLVFGMLEKYAALLVTSASAGAKVGREAFARHELVDPKIEVVIHSMEMAYFRPLRWFVHRSFAKILAGDLNSGPRKFMKLAQIQGLLLVGQFVSVIASVWIIAAGFRF
jgi:hypothetical protein